MNMCRATFAILLLLGPSVRVLRAEDFPPLPYGAPPIDYFSDEAHDPIAELASRWEIPGTRPALDPQFGRLPALLRELEIPVSSQLLVMSKTSVQQHRISPSSPRALYFRDDITVAYVAGGPDLEVTAHDSRKGTVFYLVSQQDDVPRIFSQPRNCTSCHVSRLSLNVPGHLLKSFVTDPAGRAWHERDFGGSSPNDRSEVTAAEIKADGTISITVNFTSINSVRTIVFAREGNRMRAMFNRGAGGDVTVENGVFKHNGRPTPWQHKCREAS